MLIVRPWLLLNVSCPLCAVPEACNGLILSLADIMLTAMLVTVSHRAL